MTKIILPGAWELTATNPTYKLSAIYVPTKWRQVGNNLAQQRAKLQGKSYRAVPVYSLDPLIVGSFPQIIKTLRDGWQKDNVPWLLATETAYISFVLEFVLQTVPWREKPIVYHHLSIRRWLTKPLKYVPYPGVKAHIGDNHRWLDGQRQPFCFIPLMMNCYGKEVKWPQAISNLFSLNDSQLPDANNFVSNPNHNWSGINTIPNGIQAAIAYTSKLGEPPCFAGVSPQDLASLDRAIEARLPVQRVGDAERVTGNVFIFWPLEKPKQKIVPLHADEDNQSPKPKKAKKSDNPNHSHTPMLRPKLAAPAVFREAENPLRNILVLWETPQCRDALITEICQLLYLSPTKVENIYQGFYGSLCIKTQHVGDLTENLEIQNFSETKKTYQQQRPALLVERINQITAFLPKLKN